MADRTTNHPAPDADIEQQLRVGLAELVRTAPDPTHRDLDLDDAPDPHPDNGRRRFLVGAGVATVAIGAGVGIGVLVRRDRSAPVEVMLGADPDRLAVTTDPAPATTATAWVPIDAAPLAPRLQPAIVWTGDRLIVWGGAVIDGPNRFCPPRRCVLDPRPRRLERNRQQRRHRHRWRRSTGGEPRVASIDGRRGVRRVGRRRDDRRGSPRSTAAHRGTRV